MAKRWTIAEEREYCAQLFELYVVQNKTINEIGKILNLSSSGVWRRLERCGISGKRDKKLFFNNKRHDIKIPLAYSGDLAEFFGIMLGDGHISRFQVMVTLGTKERRYAKYVAGLFRKIFGVLGKIMTSPKDYHTVYIGSVEAICFLHREGLVNNKVAEQVDIPKWIFSDFEYMKRFTRGFFDTDGSIYKLKFGVQLSFANRSMPLLFSLQEMLKRLEYRVSKISGYQFYITRVSDIRRFFWEIDPRNQKHQDRFQRFME